MSLKPQDVLVLLKLVAMGRRTWSYAALSVELAMSPSQLHSAVQRALAAGLAMHGEESISPIIVNLEEFLVHGVKYAFAPERGELTRGVPTAHAAPPLSESFAPGNEPPPVWPEPHGKVRGQAFQPLYKSAPKAAEQDPSLYELLALVDAIRGGRARERDLGVKELKKKLKAYG